MVIKNRKNSDFITLKDGEKKKTKKFFDKKCKGFLLRNLFFLVGKGKLFQGYFNLYRCCGDFYHFWIFQNALLDYWFNFNSDIFCVCFPSLDGRKK